MFVEKIRPKIANCLKAVMLDGKKKTFDYTPFN